MLYESLASLPPSQFRRACGFSRSTCQAMLEVLHPELDRSGKRGGQNGLSVESQLLLTLQYWREYRTQFHIGLDFGISEATVCRIIARVETVVVKSGRGAFYSPIPPLQGGLGGISISILHARQRHGDRQG